MVFASRAVSMQMFQAIFRLGYCAGNRLAEQSVYGDG